MSTFKPLSQYNAFFKLARERTLCGLDQLVGLHIQNKFNQAHWTDTILIADAELLECINWYDKTGSPTSIDSIRIAKARLKKKGFIDFESGKGNKPTEYRLIQLYPSDTPSDTPLDTPTETPSDPGLVCYTARAHKTSLDVKTKAKEDTTRGRTQADAGVNGSPKSAQERGQSGLAETGDNAASHADANPLNLPEIDANAIQEVWEYETGYQLKGSVAYELERLAAENFELVREAIITAMKSKGTYVLKYDAFLKVYNDMKEGKQNNKKGGEKDEQKQESGSYAIPADKGDEPWLKY